MQHLAADKVSTEKTEKTEEPTGKNQLPIDDLTEKRFALWQNVLISYASQNDNLNPQLPFLSSLTQFSINYIHHFYKFAQRLMPLIRDDASRILQQIINPDANILDDLEAEISKALKKNNFKK